MSGPVVYISHFRIKPEHVEEWWKMVEEVLPALDESKPRTVFQHFYAGADGTSVSIVHVFPDAEAVDLHMEGADTRTGEAMKFLEPLKFELYGEATGSFMAAMGDTVSLLQIEPNHMAGFDRF